MSFRFNFEVEEDDDFAPGSSSTNLTSTSQNVTSGTAPQNSGEGSDSAAADEACYHCTLDELLDTLPESISYTPLHLPFLPRPILRRDLHDARFQLLASTSDSSSNTPSDPAASALTSAADVIETARSPSAERRGEEKEYVDADTDLIPGLYEGGLKTWEGGVDLVEVLSSIKGGVGEWVRGSSVLEVGCGTALPTSYILSSLLSISPTSSSNAATSRGTSPPPPPSPPRLFPQTTLHIQDYNKPVLSLVSLPNLLLAALPFIPRQYLRSSSSDDADADADDDDADVGDVEELIIDEENGGDVLITPELKEGFKVLLEERGVELRFSFGHWSGLSRDLQQGAGIREGAAGESGEAASDAAEEGSKGRVLSHPYGLVLTAETIYSEVSVEPLIDLLRNAADAQVGLEDRIKSLEVRERENENEDVNENERQRQSEKERTGWSDRLLREDKSGSVVLVAAKVLYFGVGGGLQDFISRVQRTGGWSVDVKEWVKGVGRKVVRVGWTLGA